MCTLAAGSQGFVAEVPLVASVVPPEDSRERSPAMADGQTSPSREVWHNIEWLKTTSRRIGPVLCIRCHQRPAQRSASRPLEELCVRVFVPSNKPLAGLLAHRRGQSCWAKPSKHNLSGMWETGSCKLSPKRQLLQEVCCGLTPLLCEVHASLSA